MTRKIDLKKEYRTYYIADETPQILDLGKAQYITVEGKGAPEGEEFQAKIKAIYSVAYTIKMSQKAKGRDFVVPPLEASWWYSSDKPFTEVPREEWRWKLMIRMPDFITPEVVEKAKRKVIDKKNIELASLIKFEEIEWGKCIQMLHIGPYSTEEKSIAKMRDLAEREGLKMISYHHEIYLSDPRRVPENKLKTILRWRVRRTR